MKDLDLNTFKIQPNTRVALADIPTEIPSVYSDKKDYQEKLEELSKDLDDLQDRLFAHNKHGVLVIFQAMDAAGKDGTIKAVFSGVNPQGTSFYSFKRPSEEELNHDFMWRCFKQLPERGKITVFNRSYYEEVLVVKVHPEILLQSQRIPVELTADLATVWKNRYTDIRNIEQYLSNNGIHVIKFYLHVSKQEQAKRLIERIEDPNKNWKFEAGDIKERNFWKNYQEAFEDAFLETSTTDAPWYIIPADDKRNMRLLVVSILKKELEQIPTSYPQSSPERQAELKQFIAVIEEQNLAE